MQPDFFPVTFDNLTNHYYFLASSYFPLNHLYTNGAIWNRENIYSCQLKIVIKIIKLWKNENSVFVCEHILSSANAFLCLWHTKSLICPLTYQFYCISIRGGERNLRKCSIIFLSFCLTIIIIRTRVDLIYHGLLNEYTHVLKSPWIYNRFVTWSAVNVLI